MHMRAYELLYHYSIVDDRVDGSNGFSPAKPTTSFAMLVGETDGIRTLNMRSCSEGSQRPTTVNLLVQLGYIKVLRDRKVSLSGLE